MKTYSKDVFGKDIWREIELVFWRGSVLCLPAGATTDGIDPIHIETTKRGIEISGTIWLLPAGEYDLCLCLSRPQFSSIESVSVSKLSRAVIADSNLVDGVLTIVVATSPVSKSG